MTDMVEHIKESNVQFIRINYSDMNGLSKGKVIPAKYFLDNYHKGFPMMPLIFGSTVKTDCADDCGYGRDIDYATGLFKPDPETFCTLPWKKDTGQVICDAFFWDGSPVMGAPRSVLKKILDMLEDSYRITIGSEFEFFIFKHNGDQLVPFTSNKDDYDTLMTEKASDFYERLIRYLTHFNIEVSDIHHEYAPGQYEVNFKYKEVTEACDAAYIFRNMVRETAMLMGHHATFMPAPLQGEAGSGYHMHVALYDQKGNNMFFTKEGQLSLFCKHFIGGILKHAKALCAIQSPTINSYKRIVPGTFAPYYITWGVDHREALIRVIIDGQNTRIENRMGSSDANPYLMVASTLAAGINGVNKKIEPPPQLFGDPALVPNVERLPLFLEEALSFLEADTDLREFLGEEFIKVYTSLKKLELEKFRLHLTDWEKEYYFSL